MGISSRVIMLDVSRMDYAERLTAAAFQGLVNRDGPRLYLNWGIYDDPAARRTNEIFLPDEIWYSTFREAIGNQDLRNLEYFKSRYGFTVSELPDLDSVLDEFPADVSGAVVWDPDFNDTVNIAVMMAARDRLMVLHPERIPWAEAKGIRIHADLRGRWRNRLALYRWARRHLWRACDPAVIASVEPGWKRPEFIDYIVANRIFVYSLATKADNIIFSLGQKLLLLLVAGPFGVRNTLFSLRMDSMVRRLGMFLMHRGSAETRLATMLQRLVKKSPVPTIYGWHTRRDNEFSFMAHLSANGMRLVPSHLAGNFSFHSTLPAAVPLRQRHMTDETVKLDEKKIYLSFTLSDGDQLVLMNTAELGNWRRPERGRVPFNWEVQPLLAEMAPALLGMYYETISPADCLIAGPSGAGYIIPPLHPALKTYLRETFSVCRNADIRVVTSYIGDPSVRIVREHCDDADGLFGFTAGYVHFGRVPLYRYKGKVFVSNAVPHLDRIADNSMKTLDAVRALLETAGPPPCFIGVHLFAYRTTIKDVYEFVQSLDPARVKVVRADEFLAAASQYMARYPEMTEHSATGL